MHPCGCRQWPPDRDFSGFWQAVAVTTGICAILLAAGAGSRFAGPGHKLRADVGGASVVGRSLAAVLASAIGPVLVVTGAEDLTADVEAVARTAPAGVTVSTVRNARWTAGMATSLRAGIDAAAKLGADVVIVGLADQPGIEPDAWRRLAQCGAELAVATYDGVRGHPVRIAQRWWPSLPDTGDEGARRLLREEAEIVREVACRGTPMDVDTTDDLARLRGPDPAERQRVGNPPKE